MMNADCWRLVFDQLSIEDVVRCERVCRSWQYAVLEYLAEYPGFLFWVNGKYNMKCVPSQYIDDKEPISAKNENFGSMIAKMGPYTKSLLAHVKAAQFEDLAQHCMNLEELFLIDTRDNLNYAKLKSAENNIKRLVLFECQVPDYQLYEIVQIESLEELTMYKNYKNVGNFLTKLNKKMKELILHYCMITIPEEIEDCGNWDNMTKLQVRGVMGGGRSTYALGALRNLPYLLDKMPNLEHLAFTTYTYQTGMCEELLLESICRLSKLRELHLYRNNLVTNDFLSRVATALKNLEAVDVTECENISGPGVLGLCRARPTLKRLGMGSLKLEEVEVEECVSLCQSLEVLDAYFIETVSLETLHRMARPREPPLVLRLYDFRVCAYNEPVRIEGIKILWHWMEIGWNKPPCKITLNLDIPLNMSAFENEI